MKFSYKWLQSFFEKKLPRPKKLAEALTMHSFEVKELVKINSDWVFDIDILPNRMPDCAGHLGVAREIGAILDLKLKVRSFKLKEVKKIKINDILKVEVKDKNLCPRYSVKVITDIKVAPSPGWIQERLINCGIEPINNIVDATNYVMLETRQPLHAFDLEKISGKKIIVRRAKKGEKIATLDGKTYILTKEDLVIADLIEPIAIAGIKGGKKAGVESSTRTIVLEAANFNRLSIYRSSKRLKIQSDAALRFSSGLDPNLIEEAMIRVCGLVQKTAKGKVLKGTIDFYPQKTLPKKIKLDLNYVQDLLGVEVPQKEIIKILKSLGFTISRGLVVKIPTFRQDVSLPEDLIEEIGRIYGYQKIQPRMPILPVIIPEKNEEILWERKIKEAMRGLGFTEVYNYSFISEVDADLFPDFLIEMENPTSSNTKYLRPSLLPNLLKVVKDNQARFKDINIFEIGMVFQKQKVLERRILGGLTFGKGKFYELKGKIETFLNNLGIVNLFFDSFEVSPEMVPGDFWQRQNTAEIRIEGEEIGFLGEVSKKIIDFYQIKEPVFAFEIDFEKLLKFIIEEHEYEPPSPYPEMIQDIAIVVPTATLAGEILQKIHSAGGELIRDVEIFDIFEGPPLKDKKKNIAFHIIYQAKDRTLTSKEVDRIQSKIVKALEENPQWEVRR